MRRPIALLVTIGAAVVGPLAQASQASESIAVSKVILASSTSMEVTSTVTCPEQLGLIVLIEIEQGRGKHRAIGSGASFEGCTGEPQNVTTIVTSTGTTALRRGPTTVNVVAFSEWCWQVPDEDGEDRGVCDHIGLDGGGTRRIKVG